MWEFGAWLQRFAHIRALMRSATIRPESQSTFELIPKVLDELSSGLCAGQSSSSPNRESNFFIEPALCTGALSC